MLPRFFGCRSSTLYYISFIRYCQQIFTGYANYFNLVTISGLFRTFQHCIENLYVQKR
ncbi:MAG: hypothetical protein K6B74_00725 [Ruminococcus sp.]|nr:hypothetical protein [Ruminococcus sp.]